MCEKLCFRWFMVKRSVNLIWPMLFVGLSFSSLSQVQYKSMLRLPDTGQSMSYTTTFGEDNDYNIFPPAFTHHGDGTVTDTITGLMWQQLDGGEMTFENSQIYCNNLTLGGYTDWRLPNIYEAFSILNHQNVNPPLDLTYFSSSLADYWWTNDNQVNDPAKIWVTNAGGGIGNHPKTETLSAGGNKRFHVRAVRDVNQPMFIANRFIDNGNNTLTDQLTELTWQVNSSSDTMTWEQALIYANTLSLNGKSWRLPNVKELQSINDATLVHPCLNPLFGDVLSKKYWSSTSLPNQSTKAWYADTEYGITTYDFKTSRHFVRCVSENPSLAQMNKIDDQRATIYPNPFEDQLTVLLPSSKAVTFLLMDHTARTLYKTILTGSTNLFLDNLTQGVYTFQIQTEAGENQQGVIIKQ